MRHWVLTILMLASLVLFGCGGGGSSGGGEQGNGSPDEAGENDSSLTAEAIEASLIAAERYFDGQELAKAETILRTLIERAPSELRAHEMLARIIFKEATDAQAANRFTEARALFTEAYESYQSVLKLDPTTAGWHQSSGEFAIMAGRTDEAIEHFRESARLDPTNPKPPLLEAQLLLQKGLINEAESALKRSLALDDAHPFALATMAAIHVERGETDRAFEVLAEARALARPDEALALRVMEARFRRQGGDPHGALQLLLTLDPQTQTDAQVVQELALSFQDTNQPERAIRAWVGRYELSQDWRAAVGAGMTCLEAGRRDEARTWLTIAQASAPGHEAVDALEAALNESGH